MSRESGVQTVEYQLAVASCETDQATLEWKANGEKKRHRTPRCRNQIGIGANHLRLQILVYGPLTPIAQVQMLSFLLDAEYLKPRRTIWHKLDALDQSGSE